MTADLDELLDRDITAPFSDDEVDLLRAAGPEHLPITLRKLADLFDAGSELIPEVAYTMARFKSRPEEPVSADQLDLDLALLRAVVTAAGRPSGGLLGGKAELDLARTMATTRRPQLDLGGICPGRRDAERGRE